MKTLTSILIVTLLCPLAVQAQNKSGLIKTVKQAVTEKAASAAPKAAAAVTAQKAAAMASQQQAATAALANTMKKREDAVLRARLLGAQPVPKASAALRVKPNTANMLGLPLQYQPVWILNHNMLRLNLPLATSMLQQYKNEIINAYNLTDGYLSGYYQRRIEPYMRTPSFTADKSGYLYRGIFMTVDELVSTLQNGFLTSMNTWNVGAKNKGDKFVSFSSSATEAQSYIFQGEGNSKHPKGIGVVFEVEPNIPGVELWQDAKLNSTHTIYHCYKDVSPLKIRNVYIQGEYGLENLSDILIKARRNALTRNTRWVNQFDNIFMR